MTPRLTTLIALTLTLPSCEFKPFEPTATPTVFVVTLGDIVGLFATVLTIIGLIVLAAVSYLKRPPK